MATIYPINEHFNTGNSPNAGIVTGTLPNGSTSITSVAAEKIIQSYGLRFVSQDQIDRWDSVYKSIEQNNGVNYRWHQSVRITAEIIQNNNLITLPNNKMFYDYDSKSLVVFVNGQYISPSKYIIANKRQFYFKRNIVVENDMVEIIHLNKENKINNYDTNFMAIATTWQYSYTNNTGGPIRTIELDSEYSFINPDKYSVLVYINGEFINSQNYEIPNTRELVFNENLQLTNGSTVSMIQLSRVLPNEEYIGYMWGETINVDSDAKKFTLSKDHAFSSLQDRSALIFVNNRINRNYKLLNSNTIEFNINIPAGSSIEIIQLGYTADISKLKDIIDIESFQKYFNINTADFIRVEQKNEAYGYAGLDENGFIDTKVIDIDKLTELIKDKLIEQGWTPGTGTDTPPSDNPSTDHTHENIDVLNRLYYHDDKLYVDGYPVNERAIEVRYGLTVTQAVIADCGFELPEDCDTERPINLIVNSMFCNENRDWRLIVNDPPIKDRVYWRDLNLENLLEKNDVIYVTYYKKVERLNIITPPNNNGGANHTHGNKDLLDLLSINNNNQLCVNDVPVTGEKAIEVAYNVVADSEIITSREIKLPYDCDVSRSIVVVLNSMVQMYGVDYIIEENINPVPDKIVWTDLNMQHKIDVDDNIVVNYYRKTN